MDNLMNTLVSQLLKGAVEYVRMQLIQSRFGEWSMNKWQVNYAGEIPELFSFEANLTNLACSGLSQFEVHKCEFNLRTAELALEISIPELFFSLGNSSVFGKFCGDSSHAEINGHVTIIELRMSVKASLNISDNGTIGLSMNGVDVQIKSIKPQVSVNLNGTSYSKRTSNFLENTATEFIRKYAFIINFLVEKFIQLVVARLKYNAEGSEADDSNFARLMNSIF